jgi:cinnamoyl-CoA:phenyllactate CoA-transferase
MNYPNGNKRTLVRQPVIFTETGLPDYNRAPYVGEQTVDIMKSLGYSDSEIETMLKAKDAVARK